MTATATGPFIPLRFPLLPLPWSEQEHRHHRFFFASMDWIGCPSLLPLRGGGGGSHS
jgi:hypothetical protein